GRPIYVAPSAIDPVNGGVPLAASRIDSRFGHVTERLSDMDYTATQFHLALMPSATAMKNGSPYLVYTWTHQTRHQRGFVDTTGGDPFAVETIHGGPPVHRITLGIQPFKVGVLLVWPELRISSGAAFTPIVGSDINGDGFVNDRAYVPNLAGGITDSTA